MMPFVAKAAMGFSLNIRPKSVLVVSAALRRASAETSLALIFDSFETS
jgi:hypothetical protein